MIEWIIIVILSNLLWIRIMLSELEEWWFYHNYNTKRWLEIILIFFTILFISDLIKTFIFSKIKCRKIELNPRFWLIYSKLLPFFWFFSSIYYWLKKKNLWKKDVVYILIWNIFYLSIIYIFIVFNIDKNFYFYINLEINSLILFFILWWVDYIYTKNKTITW